MKNGVFQLISCLTSCMTIVFPASRQMQGSLKAHLCFLCGPYFEVFKNSLREDSCGHKFTFCMCMRGIHSFIHACLFAQTPMYNVNRIMRNAAQMRKSCKTLITASKLKLHQKRGIVCYTKYISSIQRLTAL